MMPGPEGGNPSNGVVAAAPAPPPPPAPAHPHHPDGNFVDRQQPAYPSLAYPSAGPSQQPPQHFPQQQQGWGGFNPYYNYGPHHGGPPQRPQPNGGGFQPNFHPGYQSYPFPGHYYPPYGQMPVPGPGPGTMQNGYYVGNGFRGFPGGEPPNAGGGEDSGAFHPQFHHQPYGYPPGHPYAYGGGIGYQQQPLPYGYRPDGFIPDHHHQHHPMHPPSKGLNPAAQGFQYQGRKFDHVMNGNVPNGDATSVSSATPEIIAPVPEKPGTGGSLGLSLDPAPEPQPAPVVEREAPVVAAEEPREEAPSVEEAKTSEPPSVPVSEVVEPVPVAQFKAVEPEAVVKLEETKVDTVAPVKVEESKQDVPKGLTFTGASLAGVASPTSAPSRRPRAFTHDPIRIRPCRPSLEVQGNSYNYRLASRIPESVAVEHIEGARRRRSTEGYSKPKGKAVLTIGVKGGLRPPALELVFGEITSSPSSPVVASTPIASLSPPARAPAPAPPKAKPSSWASLLRVPQPAGQSAPSSTLVSPSKTNVSLPSDAPETPQSAAPSLPPSSGPAPAKPRPAFNYAAAAAVGAPLSPAEDLARLLTEGLRTRTIRPSQPIIPRGLINTGNMCFANTILQVLRYCTPFTDLFEELGKRLKADLARRTPLLEAMIIFLREFVPGPSTNGSSGTSTPKGKSRDDAFIPENVYDAMKENKRFDSMRRGFQEDAEEYLGFFLNTLHEELLGLYSRTKPPTSASKITQVNGHSERTIGRPVSPGAGNDDGDDWLEVGKKQKTHVVRAAEAHESAVSRIFGGTLRSVLHAPGQKDSVTLEHYQPLQLDVQSAQVTTLVDALKHLNEPETVPGVWVQARGQNVDATKQVFFESFPQVLILHLKRFVYDPQEQNVVKRSKPVAYGTELVIPNEIISPPKRTQQAVKYRLFGVVYHHGYSATGGHYTVAVSRPDGTGWLHFDDEAVAPVPTEDVVVSEDEAHNGRAGLIGGRERCAYLLFYQRVR